MPMDDAISGQCDQPFGREIMEVGTHHFTMYDMDPYMTTLFGGEAWDLCWEFCQGKNQTNSQHKSQYF